MFNNFNEIFTTTIGKSICVGVILILFILIIISGKKERAKAHIITLSAILIGLSVVLGTLHIYKMPQGGSVTAFSLLPVVLISYFYGVRRGLLAGMVVGILNLILDPFVVHPIQLLLDYPLAFGALSLGGFIKNDNKYSIIPIYVIGVMGRFFCSFLSGVIFFGSYAPKGFTPVTWSLWYNFTYIGTEAFITILILTIPAISMIFYKMKKVAQRATVEIS